MAVGSYIAPKYNGVIPWYSLYIPVHLADQMLHSDGGNTSSILISFQVES